MLLAEVSQFSKSIESKFLFDNWNRHKDTGTGNPLVQILIVIGNLAASVSRIAVEDIKGMGMGMGVGMWVWVWVWVWV